MVGRRDTDINLSLQYERRCGCFLDPPKGTVTMLLYFSHFSHQETLFHNGTVASVRRAAVHGQILDLETGLGAYQLIFI